MIDSLAPLDSISTSSTAPLVATESASSSSSTETTAAGGTNGLLAPNEFLNLLVDNLKYQDPLDPTDSADFLSQLAALSQVQTEQQIAETDATSAATSLVGDTVSGSDASGLPVTGTVTGFTITSSGPTLDVGGDAVSLGDVTTVTSPDTPASASSPA